jgi:Endosomal/lysosomal potassium channel TMEM175
MIREKLIQKRIGNNNSFRWRSEEISRIEGLSDAVFGFAITLLVVSLEVPKTFNELALAMSGFGAFAISFGLLFLVWYNQHKFFRRYGLQDPVTIVLNAVLLFVVLFYVYPLKFLFSFLISKVSGGHGEVRLPNGNVESMLENEGQMGSLMLIFGVGYLAIFAVFVLLHIHAYRRREQLELNSLERFDTISSIQESGLNCGIALVSMSLVWFGGSRYSGLAGMAYMLTGAVMAIHGFIMGAKRKRIEKEITAETSEPVYETELQVLKTTNR